MAFEVLESFGNESDLRRATTPRRPWNESGDRVVVPHVVGLVRKTADGPEETTIE
jgi:hypothetical protein